MSGEIRGWSLDQKKQKWPGVGYRSGKESRATLNPDGGGGVRNCGPPLYSKGWDGKMEHDSSSYAHAREGRNLLEAKR